MYMHFFTTSIIDPDKIIWACGDTATIKLDGRFKYSDADLQAIAKERCVMYPQYKYVAFNTAKTINSLPDTHSHMINS